MLIWIHHSQRTLHFIAISPLRLLIFFLIFYFADFDWRISGEILIKNIPKGADFEASLYGHCLSWSLIEASRHLLCAFDVYDQCPLFVVHLRFNLFTISYPTALFSELCAFWLMQQKINPFVLSLSVPNKKIFSYHALSNCFHLFIRRALCIWAAMSFGSGHRNQRNESSINKL